MSLLLLYFLASIDAGLSGCRNAGGRNAIIDKRRYYSDAVSHAFLCGQCALIPAAVLVAGILYLRADATDLLIQGERFGWRMLFVYLPYTALIGSAFIFRVVPSVDIRCMTSLLLFGPLTLARPIVAPAGLLYAVSLYGAGIHAVVAAGFVVLMFGVEWWLNRTAERWRRFTPQGGVQAVRELA